MPHDRPEGRFRRETQPDDPGARKGRGGEAPPTDGSGRSRSETSEGPPGDAPGPGHNHHAARHLHSHIDEGDAAAEVAAVAAQFVEGFAQASDKAAFLRLAGVPLEVEGDGPPLKLVDVRLTTAWQVGTASPSFGRRELTYLPYPGSMIAPRTDMALVYVSLEERREVDLRDFLRSRDGA